MVMSKTRMPKPVRIPTEKRYAAGEPYTHRQLADELRASGTIIVYCQIRHLGDKDKVIQEFRSAVVITAAAMPDEPRSNDKLWLWADNLPFVPLYQSSDEPWTYATECKKLHDGTPLTGGGYEYAFFRPVKLPREDGEARMDDFDRWFAENGQGVNRYVAKRLWNAAVRSGKLTEQN
jgi:hypothetical protein